MGAFIGNIGSGGFLEYLVKLLVLALVAFAGTMTGKKLRENKDAKSTTVRINNTGKK